MAGMTVHMLLTLFELGICFASVVMAGVVLSVMIKLGRRGHEAVDEARLRGESIPSWLRAGHVHGTLSSPRLNERCGAAGHISPTGGASLVEERASQPSFAR